MQAAASDTQLQTRRHVSRAEGHVTVIYILHYNYRLLTLHCPFHVHCTMSTTTNPGDHGATTSPAGRSILVVGATGVQGRAFITAALSNAQSTETDNLRIFALTRSASSPSATSLASIGQKLTIVEADLDKPETVRRIFEDAKGQGGVLGRFHGPCLPWPRR